MKNLAAYIKDWAIQIIATVILSVVAWWLNDKPAQLPTVELVMWQGISNSNNAADFQEYIARYPNGQFEVIANNRLRELRQRKSEDAQAAELQRQQQLEQQRQVGLLELQKQREAEKARAAELQRQQQLEQQFQVEQERLLELQRQRKAEEKRLAELERQQKAAEEERQQEATTRPLISGRYRNNDNGTVTDTNVQNEAAKLQNVSTISPPTKKRSQLDNWLFGRGTSQ